MTGLARRRVAWVAALAALVIASVAIVRASGAALTPAGSSVWAYGELVVADGPVTAALFDVDRMRPGQAEVRCVTVRYEGGPPSADVRLYATAVSGGLAAFLDVVVEAGAGCEAFEPVAVAYEGTLDAMPASWRDASPAWEARAGARRAYRFSVTLRPDPAAEGLRASAGFVWAPGHAAAATTHGLVASGSLATVTHR